VCAPHVFTNVFFKRGATLTLLIFCFSLLNDARLSVILAPLKQSNFLVGFHLCHCWWGGDVSPTFFYLIMMKPICTARRFVSTTIRFVFLCENDQPREEKSNSFTFSRIDCNFLYFRSSKTNHLHV